jgi:CheY-like chemotaxis protein
MKPISETASETEGFAGATILVVDDDALIAMSTADMLEDLGHRVLDASSGSQALEILESGAQVDAIVTDHAMPGMTGVELAIRARELRPGIPVLLTTGYADLPPGSALELPRLGKPYQQRDLDEKLSKLLHGARNVRPSGPREETAG